VRASALSVSACTRASPLRRYAAAPNWRGKICFPVLRTHASHAPAQALDMDKVAELQAEGFLVYEPQAGLRPTPRGMALLDALLPLLRRPSTT
jgi:hypothetical protein